MYDDAMFPVIDPSRSGDAVLDRVRGCTFDDYILAPQRSVLARRDPERPSICPAASPAASR